MQAVIVTPIVTLIGLILQLVFGINLDEGAKQIITDGLIAISLLVVFAISGYKAYEKAKEKV